MLGVASTGLGKSVFAANLARALDARTLIVAHREELIDQLADTVHRWWPETTVGKVMAHHHEPDANVVVATVQTLINRLDRVPGPFDLIIHDEVHHGQAKSHLAVLDHYCGTADLLPGMPPPDWAPVVVGITATPDRSDRKGVAEWFGHRIAFSHDVRWAIEHGYLCDLRTLTVQLDGLDLDKVEQRHGDYADGALGRALQSANAPALILEAWQRHGEDRQTMIFSPTVAMSRAVADAFTDAGIAAEHMDGGARKDDRRACLARFRAGQTKVLSNVALFTEGLDVPEISCVVLARPTKSRVVYSQAVGRGLRLAPGKENCIIIDIAGAAKTQKLVQAHDLLGLHRALERHESAKQAMQREADEAADAEERASARKAEQDELDWQHGTARFANVDAFGRPAGMRHRWVHAPATGCVDRWVHDTGDWRVVFRRGPDVARTWVAGAFQPKDATVAPVHICESTSFVAATEAAEQWIDGNRAAGAWKADAPTPAQLHALRRAGWTGDPAKLTKARAGALIGKHKAAEKQRDRDVRQDNADAAQITVPRVHAAIGRRAMVSAEDVPSMLGLPATPLTLDTARRTLAAMEAKGMLRTQGPSYVVIHHAEVGA